MEQRTTVGIDLAKEVFAVCVMNAAGVVLERQRLRRAAFERWLGSLPCACVIAMEACSSAHHWGRLLAARGHTVRLIAPAFVTPFRKSGKNDAHDAEAIAIAAQQPTMRFVPLKPVRALLLEAVEQWRALDARLARCDAELATHARIEPAAVRLRTLLGVGPLTASAVVATVTDPLAFRNGRQFGAWTGLTPRQYSSGSSTKLGRITRSGDAYLRTLFVQGARSALQSALRADPAKAARLQRWIVALYQRAGYHKTLVAIANKHARIAWALLARGEHYDPNAWQRHPHAPRRAAATATATAASAPV